MLFGFSIRKKIIKNRLKEAIRELEFFLGSENNEYKNEITHILSRANRLEKQIQKNTISLNESEISYNQIYDSFLTLLQKIEEEYKGTHSLSKEAKLILKTEKASKYRSYSGVILGLNLITPIVFCFGLYMYASNSAQNQGQLKYQGPYVLNDRIEFIILNKQENSRYNIEFKIHDSLSHRMSALTPMRVIPMKHAKSEHIEINVKNPERTIPQIRNKELGAEQKYEVLFRKSGSVYKWVIPLFSNANICREDYNYQISSLFEMNQKYPDPFEFEDWVYVYPYKVSLLILLLFYTIIFLPRFRHLFSYMKKE